MLTTQETENEFQRHLVRDCIEELTKSQKVKLEGYRGVADILKRYEDRLFEFHNRKPIPVPVQMPPPQQFPPPQQPRSGEQPSASPGLRYPFISDASFQANYNRLYRGGSEPNLNPLPQQFLPQQQQPGQPLPNVMQQPLYNDQRTQPNLGFNQSGPVFPQRENRFMSDMPPSQKFQLPQGYDPNYSNVNPYNRPINDINNQPQLGNQQLGYGNSLGFQNSYPGQFNSSINQPFGQTQDNLKLTQNIEALGGIQRTLPNMQRSLNDYELRNIDSNYKLSQRPYDIGNYNPNSQNPYGYQNPPQYESQNTRGVSPAPGEAYAQLEAQYLRGRSPQKPDYPDYNRNQSYQTPSRGLVTEPDPRWNSMVINARSREASGDRRSNSAQKGFSSSRDLRQEKTELLENRYNAPSGYGDKGYYY